MIMKFHYGKDISILTLKATFPSCDKNTCRKNRDSRFLRNNIRVMKTRRKRGVKYAAGIGDIRNADKI